MEYKHNPLSLAQLLHEPAPEKPSRKSAKVTFTKLEHFALFVTHCVGSMGFFFILALWTFGWLSWNLLAPLEVRFDPAPAFVIWLFASNIIQLILLPLIMVGQNLEGKFAEHRAQADYEVNKKAAKEIETVLAHLENQNELLLEIVKRTAK